ncbi:MAG: hypothetical protein ACRDF9_10460 [Candidatus Limnocylindria bacterium]
MGLNGLLADPQVPGNGLVREASDDAVQHLAFTWGDPWQPEP